MTLAVDGEEIDVGTKLIYKGMMVSGVPNFAMATGYTNASWTLKVELIFDYLMRMWHYMDLNDLEVVVATLPRITSTRRLHFLISSPATSRARTD